MGSSAVEDAPPTSVGPEFFRSDMPVEQLRRSPLNPRKHFDQVGLEELAKSIHELGVIEPLVARPMQDHHEIVAGERRYRAAVMAGLTTLPVMVKPLTDAQALEIMVVENNQREDVSALEEADGFTRLLKSGYDLERLAERLGRSKKYVYDRMKLLDLTPIGQQLLQGGMISAGHAILLARLKPEDQARALDLEDGGVFESDGGLTDEEEEALIDAEGELLRGSRGKGRRLPGADPDSFSKAVYLGFKPKSVRETSRWIADHVRFNPKQAAVAAPLEFGAVAQRVDQALSKPGRGKKVIAITFVHYIQPEARDDQERTFGPKSFKFADGQKHYDSCSARSAVAPVCEHSVLGVVAVGEKYGQAFDVCIARDKCQVHWKKEIAERSTNEKLRGAGKTKEADKRENAWQAQQRREQEQREKRDARWKLLLPVLRKAFSEARAKLKVVTGPLYAEVMKANRLPPATKPADLPLAMLDQELSTTVFGGHVWAGDEPRVVAWAKLLGIDVKALEPKAGAAERPAVQTSPKSKSKAKKKR